MCNIPIIPILSSRELSNEKPSLKRKYTLLPAIYPPNFVGKKSKKNKISKEEFAEQTMQKLYSILEQEVTKNEQVSEWEGWIFVNKFFEQLKKPILRANQKDSTLLNDNLNPSYIFNEERFALIESNQNTLFDKFTYRFFPVSDLLYEIITYFSAPKKLYLSNRDNKLVDNMTENSSHSPVSTHSDSKLQLSKTRISVSTLEKLIEKNILVQHK
jgi:hypothetical protein